MVWTTSSLSFEADKPFKTMTNILLKFCQGKGKEIEKVAGAKIWKFTHLKAKFFFQRLKFLLSHSSELTLVSSWAILQILKHINLMV